MRRRWSDRSSRRVRTLVTQLARSRLVRESGRMRADIHDGPEQTLQSEAGYSNARPHQPGRRNLLHRTAGPYSWVIRVASRLRRSGLRDCPLCPESDGRRRHVVDAMGQRGREQCSKGSFIRSPRRRAASKVGGTSRPSALAVLRLMTSSNLVGACTGRSAGFSPLRMRST